MKRRMSTAREREVMAAFLGGFTEELTLISVDQAMRIVRKVTRPEVLVTTYAVSGMLESLGFERQPYHPSLGVTYRRVPA